MGNTEPQNPQYDTAAAPGPRVAAARTRNRKKRILVIAAATGVTLAVAGTATAAVIAAGTSPETTVNAAQIPQAEPDPLTSDAPAEPDPAHAEQAGQAVSSATQTTTADGSAVPEEDPEPDAAPDSDSGQDSAPSTDATPTGEGGTCQASFYGDGFHGATTANGETFDTYGMTAAHKTLPFDTMVKVTNPSNGKSVTVRINDRGPYIDGRCLDLSTAAFDEIIGTGAGVGTVEWQVVG